MTAASPAIDPSRTAVVLIEYQNDFTSEGGTLHAAVAPVMESTGMLENTVELVEKARAAGATIVHTPISFAPGYERGYQVYTLTDCLAATSAAEHENAIANDYPMFSRPVTSTEFAAALTGEQETLSGSSRAAY